MIYALVSATNTLGNPGQHMIAAGVKRFLLDRDQDARFIHVSFDVDDPSTWHLIRSTCHKIVMCGNPRFNGSEEKSFTDWGVWERVIQTGLPYLDLWGGATVGWADRDEPEQQAYRLLRVQKNREVLRYIRGAEEVIARDQTTQIIYSAVRSDSRLLPCCSFRAAEWYGVKPGTKDVNAIVLRALPGHDWIIANAKRLKARLEPCLVVCHTYRDFLWAQSLKPLCLSDPVELLRLYARVNELHSFRLHASIPALSLGAVVHDYSIDSRSDALELFGVQSRDFTSFGK